MAVEGAWPRQECQTAYSVEVAPACFGNADNCEDFKAIVVNASMACPLHTASDA
jgi:hypothetical protein